MSTIFRKKFGLLSLLLLMVLHVQAQDPPTRLLIRIDDMGFSHAANIACIETYQEGVAKSVEVIVPGPWFEEAASLLQKNPGLDAGVHLVLTSEWANLKWRPLTPAPSLVDEDGYFFPMLWENKRFPPDQYLLANDWKIEEVEAEWRAQIELAKKKIPQLTHVSGHMGCSNISEAARELMRSLAAAYGLDIHLEDAGVKRVPSWSGSKYSAKQKEKRFIQMLEELGPGDWILVEHPGYAIAELETVGHIGYENVGIDRDGVTKVFTSKKVKKAIQKKGIQLISYTDLK